ncbi:TPA: toxin [Enterobacter cancerogenus]|nr:toxin [Enterobacter cancerogenus]
MYNENVLLNKAGKGAPLPLTALCGLSAAEINNQYEELSWGESQFLARQAAEQEKQNRMLEARVFSRANPQLASAVRLGINQARHARSYDSQFGSRAAAFVSPDSVASMFSPAAYLTVLYREAQDLHFSQSAFYLNNRRPDLASLSLNQRNMEEEVSTLTLANEVLAEHISRQQDTTPEELLKTLATHRLTGQTPYHQPYETVRQVILEKQPDIAVLSRNPDVTGEDDTGSLLAILANISPELKAILVEDITEQNAAELYEKNFAQNVNEFNYPRSIADYYGLSLAELAEYTGGNDNLLFHEDSESGTGSMYVDGRFTRTVLSDNGVVEKFHISILGSDNTSQLHYLELIPLGGNQFKVSFSVTQTLPERSKFSIRTAPEANELYREDGFVPQAGKHYSYEITLPESALENVVTIGIQRQRPIEGGYFWSSVNFRIETLSPQSYLLKLNKVIRLCQATGLSPSQLDILTFSSNTDGVINRNVMGRLFSALFYKIRYGLALDDALVLSGALISRQTSDGQTSHFDRIFNTPPLGGTMFDPNGKPVLLQTDSGKDSFATAALIRGLGVNNGELLTLCRLMDSTVTDSITGDIPTISHLWRLCLLAREHNLSVLELSLLYRLSPCRGLSSASLTLSQWRSLTEFLYQTTLLMSDAAVSASELYLMCTPELDETLTPEMNNLLLSLRPRLQDVAIDEHGRNSLSQLLSPFIAAALTLSSPEMGRYVLLWSEALRPEELSITGFAKLAAQESLATEQKRLVARYCHALAQTAVRVQILKLSEAEVAALINSDHRIIDESASADPLETLRSLYAFHQWLNHLGTRSSEMLAAIEQGTLTPEMLATIMETELLMIEQAMACAEVTDLSHWQNIYRVLQWKNVSNALNVMPATVRQLLSLQYVSLPNRSDDNNWQRWQHLAHAMEAAVEGRAVQELESLTAERYSTVLSAWFRAYCQPVGTFLRNRDELYSYLLIDNQVSAQVRTSRLAEAIASLQLYINRALNRMENGTRTDVITRQFFLDWSLYSRYSSWSGVSMLAYYPENYIDPTLRIGQTHMMDELLENISQGKLSQDAVEDAFKTYLTRFETVADLTVVSAYHDNVNSDSGTTWLLGRSKENLHEYHWRTVDMSKLQDGSLPANAWGEWTRIEMPLNAWQDMVRPVVFRERLYVIWVERDEIAVPGQNNQVSMKDRFTLKLAFRRHDGTWSAPWNHDVSAQIESIPVGTTPLGLCAAGFAGEDTLLVFIYRIAQSYANFGENNNSVTGVTVHGDGTFRALPKDALSRYSELKNTFSTHTPSTDITVNKANYQFAVDYDIPSSLNLISSANHGGIIKISNARLNNITYNSSSEVLRISIENSIVSLAYNTDSNLMKYQQKAMNFIGDSRDSYIIAGSVNEFDFFLPIRGPYFVYNKNKNIIGAALSMRAQELLLNKEYLFLFEQRDDGINCFIDISENRDVLFKINLNGDEQDDFRKCEAVLYFSGNILSEDMTEDDMHNNRFLNHHIIREWFDTDFVFSPASTTLSIAGNKFTANETQGFELRFNPIEFSAQNHFGGGNVALIDVDVTTQNKNGETLSTAHGTLRIRRVDFTPENIIQLHSTDTGAQYMQLGVHRIRLNTLLGPQLVSLAATGIDAILAMSTQHLPEPQLGKGFYAIFTLPAYNAAEHGTNRNFRLHLGDILAYTNDVIYSGQFQDNELTVRLFIPQTDIPLDSQYVAKVFLTTQHRPTEITWGGAFFTDNNGTIGLHSNSDISMFSSVNILRDTTEPMDFNGACALYFWELFYYTPMMAFQRLLQEQNFSEATRWLNYVWNPAGYIVQGQLQNYRWNVRPLEEETSWNADPLDSVDPDAAAQADPMHYKVATFMRMLDLLIARGDTAYRQLERDTLNEAKMWYVQALALLGDEPDITFTAHWSEPTLSAAADKTLQRNYQQMLARLCEGENLLPETRTANSLTGLFFPEFNAVLSDYWKTLRQRLFNLRHHLSIDGQPLSLSIFAERADPSQLLSSMVLNAQDSSHLPAGTQTLWRFPVMLERARNTVAQLTQFGTTLLSLAEHQDADHLNTLLMQQGMELVTQSIRLQERVMDEVAADRKVIEENRRGAQVRLATYQRLWEEGISRQEQRVMDMQTGASSTSLGAQGFVIAAGIADMVPNIFGFAVGGSRWGGALQAAAEGVSIATNATLIAAERMGQSESYRRRREEWEIQRDSAESEIRQFDAQLKALDIRYEAAGLQVEYLQTQQAQTLAQMEFLQRKFTNQALYNWMRGKLSAIYYQFFDLSQSLCLMAQESLRRELNDAAATYVRGGAWNGASAGFMAGETLLLNLTEMEKVWLERDSRALEVTRTVSLAQVYRGLGTDSFELKDKLAEMLNSGNGGSGITGTELKFSGDGQLQASVLLAKLDISNDYPAGLGQHRQIKQVSVTLPALVGPYEDVRAVLNYGGSLATPKGCNAIAVSHGMNDSGQFVLDFNDARYLPFEGIPVNDGGSLTLSFPDATGRQKALLQSLNDIILHIRYTIQS